MSQYVAANMISVNLKRAQADQCVDFIDFISLINMATVGHTWQAQVTMFWSWTDCCILFRLVSIQDRSATFKGNERGWFDWWWMEVAMLKLPTPGLTRTHADLCHAPCCARFALVTKIEPLVHLERLMSLLCVLCSGAVQIRSYGRDTSSITYFILHSSLAQWLYRKLINQHSSYSVDLWS